MKFTELQELIPYARFGKEKSLTMQPYRGITLALPGRHAEDTTPKGGDFVVMVTDSKISWKNHQFTHTDLFKDVGAKAGYSHADVTDLMECYYNAIVLDKPLSPWEPDPFLPGLTVNTFLCAVQCLGVAEHRRYAQYEPKGGGRYLPLRFAAGIAEGLWTASDAADKQKRGRPGVEWLERDYGLPALTKRLLDEIA